MTTTRPYELLARFAPDGTIAGVHVRTITTVNGRDFEGDPQPLSDASDPAFVAFAESFAAAVVAERDTLKTQLESSPKLHEERDQLASQVETLKAEIDALKNPPMPQAVTPAQIRIWLVSQGISLDQTDQFIAAIPDPMHREIARIKWEYGVTVLRNDPLVAQFAAAIGLTEAQTDAAFEEASRL